MLACVSAYLLWGLVPLFWKQLARINPVELIAHRHLWSLGVVLALSYAQGGLGEIVTALRQPGGLTRNLLSAGLLTANWLVYVWGVNSGRVVETSLGYFLVPLVSVALGRFVLGEELRRGQWIAISVAALGVVVMVVQVQQVPWIALAIAGSWSCYALMRKRSRLGSLTGLAVETLLLAPFAVAFLCWQHHLGQGALGRGSATEQLLVLSSGVITAVPLLLFGYAAQRIRLSTLGILQYLAPTVQFALGVALYREPFSSGRAAGFVCIWIGLAGYVAENLLRLDRSTRRAMPRL